MSGSARTRPRKIINLTITAMKLLTKEILKRLPTLGSSGDKELGEIVAQVKFFYPDFSWTWYAAEWDGEDIFWGLVAGDELEAGTFSLSELRSTRGKLASFDRRECATNRIDFGN